MNASYKTLHRFIRRADPQCGRARRGFSIRCSGAQQTFIAATGQPESEDGLCRGSTQPAYQSANFLSDGLEIKQMRDRK